MAITPPDSHRLAAPGTGPTLARHIGLWALILYGVGDMVGAGIYATIGKAAGAMGNAVWLAFVAAMVPALLTGLSYACLSSRYPRAAGAAFVTHRAYGVTALAYVLGLAVMASGLTSMATSSNAFADNLARLVPWLGRGTIVVVFLIGLTLLNLWGIRESMWANALCTLVEVGGLVLIVVVGLRFWGSVDYLHAPAAGGGSAVPSTPMVLSGAVLAFFAFVGFEDMLNVAEEVKNPRTTMPLAIIAAIAIATLLYVAVAITAVSVVPYDQLANDKLGAPLEQIRRTAAPWLPPNLYTFITLFAVANTSLLNFVMGSRLAYGMARQGLLPSPLGRVDGWRRTPHVAIVTLAAIAVGLAFSGGVKDLGEATALLLLLVFMVVNGALIVLLRRPGEARGRFEVPVAVPLLGALTCGALVAARVTAGASLRPVWIAGGLLVATAVLFVIQQPKAAGAGDDQTPAD